IRGAAWQPNPDAVHRRDRGPRGGRVDRQLLAWPKVMKPLPPRIPLDSLLTLAEIAAALKFSIEHVRNRVVRQAGFPPPVLNSRRGRRWSRQSIEEWLRQQA